MRIDWLTPEISWPIQWIDIVLLTLLILTTVAMVNDRPFAAGGNTVQPSALLELKG